MPRPLLSLSILLAALALQPRGVVATQDAPRIPFAIPDTVSLVLATGLTFGPDGGVAVVTMKLPINAPDSQEPVGDVITNRPVVAFREDGEDYVQGTVDAQTPELKVELSMRLGKPRSFERARDTKPRPASAPDNRWLIQEEWVAPRLKQIVEIAATCPGTKVEDVARWAFGVCRERLRYSENAIDVYLAHALHVGEGDCSEYSDLFVSLCRARGVAARTCIGFKFDSRSARGYKHQWAEVFDPDYGWIVVDPVEAAEPSRRFDEIRHRLLLITHERNDPLLGGRPYVMWDSIEGEPPPGDIRCELIQGKGD